MRHHDQPDLFAEPPSPAAETRTLLPPYTLAELTELDRQLRQFDRIPDEWCAGWWTMYERAHDTIRQTPRDQRAAIRAVFFEEAERLMAVEWAEADRAEAERAKAERAAAAAAPSARRQARRRAR